MNSRLRRSLVLTTLLTLVLGVSGAAAPIALARSPTDTRVAGIDIDATTIPELQELMDAHRLKSVQLTQFYLHRIRKLNPTLNAVITVSPTALADARAADAARRRGDDRPLLGIPIIVKDNINTTGMADDGRFLGARRQHAGRRVHRPAAQGRRCPRHRQGQPVRVGELPVRTVVERLERDRRPDEHGLRPRPQPLRLELRLRRHRSPLTSQLTAVGTETDGSIVCPSGANAIVGIKPTLGLWSRAGVVPISADQDTAGPMARNVTDAAVLLGALTGVDPTTRPRPSRSATPSPTTRRSWTTERARRRPDRRLARGQLRGDG